MGGFSADIAGQRAYLIQTGEKGIHWTRMIAEGTAGHGLAVQSDNPVVRLGGAVQRIGEHEWPIEYTKTTRALMEQLSELTGIPFDEEDPSALLEATGSTAKFIAATLQNTSNPTVLEAGYKHNVVPGSAEALVDARTLPEQDEKVAAKLAELAGEKIRFELMNGGPSLEVPFSGALVEQMVSALRAEDPDASCCRTCWAAAPTTSTWPHWGSPATASPRCGCRPISTSPGCSTVWTNGCRWTL